MKYKNLLLLVPVCIMALASCGKETGYDENNFNATGDRIVKETINLTFFAPLHALHDKEGYNDMKLFKKMEEITGIHINWVYGSASTYDEIRASQWQAKERPDAFFLWNPTDEVYEYGKAGLVYELTEYINDYAPNYKAILDGNPEYQKLATFDGNMYSTLAINDVPRDQTFKQYINQKWLDALDLDMPTSVEDYLDVLNHFKNDDPNGNGIPDEIPLSSASLYQTRNFLMSAFGHVSTGLEVDDNGNVIYVPSTTNYRSYLEYAHSLYVNKYLDNNTFVMTERDVAAKGDLVGSFDGSAAYLIAGMDNDADYTAIPPLTSSINSEKMWLGFNTTTPSAIMVPKTTPYIREIVRWMDFLYSQQGIYLQCFGEENVDFVWTDETKSSFVFEVPEGQSIEEYRGTITPGVGLGQVTYWDKRFVLKEANAYTQRINDAVESAGYMDFLKIPLPDLVFTANEKSQIAIIETDLEIYMDVFEQKCVSGRITLSETEWTNHLNTLNQIHVADLLSVYQAAYDRYLER